MCPTKDKSKCKNQIQYSDYLVINSEIKKKSDQKKKYQDNIKECNYISWWIVDVKLEAEDPIINIVTIYSPENNKPTH